VDAFGMRGSRQVTVAERWRGVRWSEMPLFFAHSFMQRRQVRKFCTNTHTKDAPPIPFFWKLGLERQTGRGRSPVTRAGTAGAERASEQQPSPNPGCKIKTRSRVQGVRTWMLGTSFRIWSVTGHPFKLRMVASVHVLQHNLL